jgi:excisionase family DNA binding protein
MSGIPQLLTLDSLSKTLCVSPHTVRSWVRAGRLSPTRICRRLLFDPSEVTRFLEEAKDAKHRTTGQIAKSHSFAKV